MEAARCRGPGMQDNTEGGIEAWGTPTSRDASRVRDIRVGQGMDTPRTVPRGVPSRTKACRRRRTASARASLPLPAAPDARRWAHEGPRSRLTLPMNTPPSCCSSAMW